MKNSSSKSHADERFDPSRFEIPFDPFYRHYLRYFTCLEMIGKLGIDEHWLDCASGTGYGTYFLSNFTSKITGYDIDKETVLDARARYKKNNLKFEYEDIKIKKRKYDIVFSIETIEHIDKKEGQKFLEKLFNCLDASGRLIITTPIVSKTNINPTNPFHVIEYDKEEFIELLNTVGLEVISEKYVETLFTDNELKNQGYFLCKTK